MRVSPDDAGWWPDPPILLSATADWHADEEPSLATDGGARAYVAWQGTTGSAEGYDIWLSRTSDRGATWSPPQRIDTAPPGTDSLHVRLCALPEGQVYAAWEEGRLDGSWIFFTRSLDHGATWEPEFTLDTAGAAHQPRIACSTDGGVYVVWEDGRHGANQVYAAVSGGHGASGSWTEVGPISTGAEASGPEVAADDHGELFVVWVESGSAGGTLTEVMVATGRDHGQVWEPSWKIDRDDVGQYGASAPTIAATSSGAAVLAAWLDDRPESSVYANVSFDAGASWQDPDMPIDRSGEGGWARDPVAAIGDDGRAFVAWADLSPSPIGGSYMLVNSSQESAAPGSWLGTHDLDLNRRGWEATDLAGTMTRDGAAVGWRARQSLIPDGHPLVNRWRILPVLVGEVMDLRFESKTELVWDPIGVADHYNVYRGMVEELPVLWCHEQGLEDPRYEDLEQPDPGRCFTYLVTGANWLGEGPLGQDRENTDPCE